MEIINICYDKNFVSENLINVDIRNIDSVPNFSAPRIVISFLNKLKKEQGIEAISILCNKLKKNGTLTFTLLDFDQLISFYHNQKLNLDDIIKHMRGNECFISRSEIIKMFHKSSEFSIDSITYDDIYSVYTLSRIDL